MGVDPTVLTTHYETARALAVGDNTQGHSVIGLTVLYRWGVPAWIHAVQNAALPREPVRRAQVTTSIGCSPAADAAETILILASMLLAFRRSPASAWPH